MYYERPWVRAEAELVYYIPSKIQEHVFESAFILPFSCFLFAVAFAE
jgi:hypothetical protein